ncbi:unnamed protein product [Gongylonema pulchrum]|uniref:Uncharacterized protein n=1 Tax=Gongylonema pulchrum TaxID=637853 RepID=A0A183D2X1_9BILA|nr:unnamed protein product [Gongylonema pulchrum]
MGSDKAIRKATAQLPNGHLWTRPISYFAPLEIPSQTDGELTSNTVKHQFKSGDPYLDREAPEVDSDNFSEKADKNHDVTVVMDETANTHCRREPNKGSRKFYVQQFAVS